MFSTLWLKDTVERALATAVQMTIALFTADGFNLLSVHWSTFGVAVGTAVILVVLKAAAAALVSPTVSPASLAPDERGI